MCKLGESRCLAEAPGMRQVCRPDLAGKNAFDTEPCSLGEICFADLDDCALAVDQCIVGTQTCSDDLSQVLECQRPLPLPNIAKLLPVYSCAERDMACIQPGYTPKTLLDWCVNECGGRGLELGGSACQLDPVLPCGVLVCDYDTGVLKSDHLACLAVGFPCVQDAECAGCTCTGGICATGTPKVCTGDCP